MLQSRRRIDIEAAVCVCCRCLGVDDNEAISVGLLSELGARVKGLGSASAPMEPHNEARVGLDVIRNIYVHPGTGGIGTKVEDLLERSSVPKAGEGEEGGEFEEHPPLGIDCSDTDTPTGRQDDRPPLNTSQALTILSPFRFGPRSLHELIRHYLPPRKNESEHGPHSDQAD